MERPEPQYHSEPESTGIIEYFAKDRIWGRELGEQFYRIHREYLINLSYVEGYDKTEGKDWCDMGISCCYSRYKIMDGLVQGIHG